MRLHVLVVLIGLCALSQAPAAQSRQVLADTFHNTFFR